MTGNWIDNSTIERSLRDQADRLAVGLGHRMTSWVAIPERRGQLIARCVVCCESAKIAVRQLRLPPIAGAAVELRCRPKRAV
jgi:hypothetical protein